MILFASEFLQQFSSGKKKGIKNYLKFVVISYLFRYVIFILVQKLPNNLAAPVDPNYAVIVNIILWMSLLIVISVLAISIGIWNMDPGRDSIIYRMTSQRMKKD